MSVTPAVLALLLLVPYVTQIVTERLYIVGPAVFYWPALQSGWTGTVIVAWACWLLVPVPRPGEVGAAPSATALFALLMAQAMTVTVALALLFVPLVRAELWTPQNLGMSGQWVAWAIPICWIVLAQSMVAWRGSRRSTGIRAAAIAVMTASVGLGQWLEPPRHWYPDYAANGDSSELPRLPTLTQADIESQSAVATARLDDVPPQRPGRIDLYGITFAPYAEEDVFRRESDLVANVIAERFDATSRVVQLVNHRETMAQWPWATPTNLERTIRRVAERMDRDEDVLFIHLTSHGAKAGSLSASFRPLEVEPVTPQQVKAWLDAAGIKHRVVSVSACYSGSWIEPLAGDDTLVMTAADAEHTSLGCGRKSVLTYFGRAMYDEELRLTRSFEEAHAKARIVIEQRERDAGKRDGHSNPQIAGGAAIRSKLAALEAQLR